MIYMRGQAEDYDHWRQLGNTGWSWDDVLPFFLRSEDHHGGGNAMHGTGGEWKVARQRLSWDILSKFQEAATEFGIMPRDDFNDGGNEGSGFFEVNQRNGIRWNTSKAFLRPVRKRNNLRVVTGAHTDTLMFNGKRVTGVRYRSGDGVAVATAGAEVILAAGAINSPKILELSGVGDGDLLGRHGLEVVHHNKMKPVSHNRSEHESQLEEQLQCDDH